LVKSVNLSQHTVFYKRNNIFTEKNYSILKSGHYTPGWNQKESKFAKIMSKLFGHCLAIACVGDASVEIISEEEFLHANLENQAKIQCF